MKNTNTGGKFHEIDFPGEYRPYSYGLKTIIIKNRLCIGAVGDVYPIKCVFDLFMDFFLHREVTSENLNEMLLQNNLSENKAVSTLVLFADLNGGILVSSFGSWKTNSSFF